MKILSILFLVVVSLAVRIRQGPRYIPRLSTIYENIPRIAKKEISSRLERSNKACSDLPYIAITTTPNSDLSSEKFKQSPKAKTPREVAILKQLRLERCKKRMLSRGLGVSDGLSDKEALGVSRHSELSDEAIVDPLLLLKDFDFDRKYSLIQKGRKELTEKSPRALARKYQLLPNVRASIREPLVLESTETAAEIFPPPPRAGKLHLLGGQSLLDDQDYTIRPRGGEWRDERADDNLCLSGDLFDTQSNTQPIGEELRVERLTRDTTDKIVEGVEMDKLKV
jgi:hypothetical protein